MVPSRLQEIARRVETSCYIYDEDVFAQRAELVRDALGEKVGLCFSIKANPFILRNLPQVFSKIEVCSPGELTICEKLGLDMHRIVFSGVNKMPEDVKRAMDDGVGIFTVESYRHLDLIEKEAERRGITVPVLIRIAKDTQFGMDREDVCKLIAQREAHPAIRIEGVHYFTGTQKKKAKFILKELDYLKQFIADVKQEYGYTVNKVEYGTGLAVDYFSADADELERTWLSEISEGIRELAEQTELTVEMGRFFAAPCGYYITEVEDTKTNGGIHYAICDGGMNQLKYDGQLQGMQTPVIIPVKLDKNDSFGAEDTLWTLCGSLCTTADVMARNVALGELTIGDRLVFHRTGAYSLMEGITTFLSRETAVVYLYSEEKGLRKIRERMYSDVMNTPYRETKIEL